MLYNCVHSLCAFFLGLSFCAAFSALISLFSFVTFFSLLSRLQLWFVFCPPQPLHRPVGLFGHDLNPSSCMLLAGVWQQHAAVSASAADLR